MHKKILLFILTITNFYCYSFSPFPTQNQQPRTLFQFASISPEAKHAISILNQLPEFRELLMKVQREGPVHLRLKSAEGFDGLWESISRTISVSTKRNPTIGQMICTILFELHNASTTRYYDQLIDLVEAGQLTKDQYVEKVEYAEYKNARNTRMLLEKGIQMGIFPPDAHWPIPPTFDEHYKVQQICGHSAYIANNYNQFFPKGRHTPYHGTIRCPQQMTENDKNALCRLVAMRAAMESDDENAKKLSWKDFNNELALIEQSYQKRATKQEIMQNKRRIELMKTAFAGNKNFVEMCNYHPYLA